MTSRQFFRKITATILVGLGSAGLCGTAAAQSTASAKATFAYNTLVSLTACNTLDAAGCTGNTDTGWRPILRQQIKLANQKDLFLGASLQCGIVTDTTVKSLNGSLDSAEARGTIRVRIKITAPDGTVTYALPSVSVDANNNTTGSNGGVVFCDRIQTLKAKFSGLNCTADATGAVTCRDPEELQLILKTLNANAFNFIAPNLATGVHAIEVQARSSTATSATGVGGSLGAANAFIGAGSVAVESVRMIKGNDGTTLSLD